jgi:hypothetical protein
MNPQQHNMARQHPLRWSLTSFAVSAELVSKVGMAAVIFLSFLRAVWHPEAGFPAIGFWLLLFFAAVKADAGIHTNSV